MITARKSELIDAAERFVRDADAAPLWHLRELISDLLMAVRNDTATMMPMDTKDYRNYLDNAREIAVWLIEREIEWRESADGQAAMRADYERDQRR